MRRILLAVDSSPAAERARSVCATLAAENRAAVVEYTAPAGSPAAVARRICRRAEELDADLIVMGSRGLSGFRSLMVGSVSHLVLAETRLPVMLVKRPSRTTPRHFGDHRALVGVASLEDAESALAALREVPSIREVVLLFVTQEEAAEGAPDRGLPEEWVAPFRAAGYEVSEQVAADLIGEVAYAISEMARAARADLIVLASRRLPDLDALLVGSTAHGVLRHCDRPVLLAERHPAKVAVPA
jgi:nucleotide-binding universal stress UspA family protein